MREEETAVRVNSPYCRSKEDCSHLLAVIDQTFDEMADGYACDRVGELYAAISESFLQQIRGNVRASSIGRNKILTDLWTHAIENYTPAGDDEISFDDHALMRLIIALFESAGSFSEDGPPGYSSVMCVFHAEKPSAVFEAALTKLRLQLQQQRTTDDGTSSQPSVAATKRAVTGFDFISKWPEEIRTIPLEHGPFTPDELKKLTEQQLSDYYYVTSWILRQDGRDSFISNQQEFMI